MTDSTITADQDDAAARLAAAKERERIDACVLELHRLGAWTAAESLTLAAENADLNSPTWGLTYIKLRGLGR